MAEHKRNRKKRKPLTSEQRKAQNLRQAAHRAAHPEEKRVHDVAYRAKHAEQIHVRNVAWHAEHPDAGRINSATFRAAHPEQRRAEGIAYSAANPEKKRASAARCRAAHPEKARAKDAAYKASHPEICRAQNKRRRALKRGALISDFTAAQWQDMQEQYDYRCAYCDKRAKGHLTQDHILALSKGGNHTLANIIPACASCNSKKKVGPPPVPVQPMLLTLAPSKRKKAA